MEAFFVLYALTISLELILSLVMAIWFFAVGMPAASVLRLVECRQPVAP